MKLRTKMFQPFERRKKLFIYNIDFERSEPYPRVDISERTNELCERRGDVKSVSRKIDTRKHYFAGRRDSLTFRDDALDSPAATPSSQIRYQTVRTEIIASVLYFDVAPRTHTERRIHIFVFLRKFSDLALSVYVENIGDKIFSRDAADVGHVIFAQKLIFIVLGCAAAYDYPRVRVEIQTASHCLTRFSLSFVRNSAGVEHIIVGVLEFVSHLKTANAQFAYQRVALIFVLF